MVFCETRPIAFENWPNKSVKAIVNWANGKRKNDRAKQDMKAADKKMLKEVLSLRNTQGLVEWSLWTRAPLRKLFSLTYDKDRKIRYQAIEAIGLLASRMAKKDEETVRNFLRSLLWLMSEESGGIGWHAPEAIAEICINLPQLSEEYARLLPQFVKEDSFRPSALAALYRLAPTSPDIIKDHATEILYTTGAKHEFQVYDFSKRVFSQKMVWHIFELAGLTNEELSA